MFEAILKRWNESNIMIVFHNETRYGYLCSTEIGPLEGFIKFNNNTFTTYEYSIGITGGLLDVVRDSTSSGWTVRDDVIVRGRLMWGTIFTYKIFERICEVYSFGVHALTSPYKRFPVSL